MREDSPMTTLLLSVMGAFVEFERSLIQERQRESIEIAKKRGAYKEHKEALSETDVVAAKSRIEKREKKHKLPAPLASAEKRSTNT